MSLPMVHYQPNGPASEHSFELWRDLVGHMYDVTPAGHAEELPGGSVSAVLVGDILANRTSFSAQRVRRNKRLISRTPDHLILQLWRTGGTRGEVDGRDTSYTPGQVALADRRLEVDSLITRSDTVGVVIPRSVLDGMQVDELPRHLDRKRNQLAAAHLTAFWRRIPDLDADDVETVKGDFIRFFRRLFDPSQASDVLEGPELASDLTALAEDVIDRNLGSPMLSPDMIAAALGISRATLYRLFARRGGIMRHIGERRLAFLRRALGDPLERRPITRLAEELGFSSLPVLSRTFRARYGVPPREWRAENQRRWRDLQRPPDPIKHWFSKLGQ